MKKDVNPEIYIYMTQLTIQFFGSLRQLTARTMFLTNS